MMSWFPLIYSSLLYFFLLFHIVGVVGPFIWELSFSSTFSPLISSLFVREGFFFLMHFMY